MLVYNSRPFYSHSRHRFGLTRIMPGTGPINSVLVEVSMWFKCYRRAFGTWFMDKLVGHKFYQLVRGAELLVGHGFLKSGKVYRINQAVSQFPIPSGMWHAVFVVWKLCGLRMTWISPTLICWDSRWALRIASCGWTTWTVLFVSPYYHTNLGEWKSLHVILRIGDCYDNTDGKLQHST